MISNMKSNKGCTDEGNALGSGCKSIRVYLPLLLVALVCISAIPLIFGTDEADAAVGDMFIVDDINYRVTEEGPLYTVEVIWNSYTGIVVIPSSVTNAASVTYEVTGIGHTSFLNRNSLTSITIPNSVTSIGEGAFQRCSSLTSVTIPNSVTSIGGAAFAGSGLTSVTIPNSVAIIEASAFDGCSSLTSVTIPNSVAIIGNNAFDGCSSLTSVTIPNWVAGIGQNAFGGCSSLTSVTIPNSVTSIGHLAFHSCESLQIIAIPDGLDISNTDLDGKKIVRYSPASGAPSGIKFGVNAVIDADNKVTLTYVNDRYDLVSFTGSDFIYSSPPNTFLWPGSNVSVTVDFQQGDPCNVTVIENTATNIILSDGILSSDPQAGVAYVGHDYVFSVSGVTGDIPFVKIFIDGDLLTEGTEYTVSGCMYTISGTYIVSSAEIIISAIGTFTVIAEHTGAGTLMYSVNNGTPDTFPTEGVNALWNDEVLLFVSPDFGGCLCTWEWNGTTSTSDDLMITNKKYHVKVNAIGYADVTFIMSSGTYKTGANKAFLDEDYVFTITSDPGVIFAIYVTIGTGTKQSLLIDAGNTYIIPMADIIDDIVIETILVYTVTFDTAPGTYNTGTATALMGEDYVFTITSDPGVIFDVNVTIGGLTVNLSISGSTYTIPAAEITGDVLIVAIVTAYSVSVATIGNGSVYYSLDGVIFTEYDPSTGDIIVGNGNNLILEAVPSRGNRFSGWEGSVPSGDEMNETITLFVNDVMSLTAKFSVVSSYNVYKQPGEGTDIIGNSKANRNADYIFTVTRTEGYVGNPTITVTSGNYSVQYTGVGTITIERSDIMGSIVIRTSDLLKEDEFITINVEGKGTVRYSTDNGNSFLAYQNSIHIPNGATVVLKAIPDDDSVLKEWRGITLSDNRSDTVSVNNTNKTITAVFSSSDDNGSIIKGIDNIVLIAVIVIVATVIIGCVFVFVIRAR